MPYTISPYDFSRNDEVLNLLHRVFKPWTGGIPYFDWKYNRYRLKDCRFPTGWVIEHQGKIAAFNGYLPRKVKLGNEIFWCLQSFDTVTDPEYRGKKLFEQLQNQIYIEAAQARIAWIYGWTSEIGFKVFTQKAGWKIWGKQGVLMRVLDPEFFLKTKLKNTLAVQIGKIGMRLFLEPQRVSWNGDIKTEVAFSPQIDELCAKAMSRFDMVAIRDATYLNWRISNPNLEPSILCAYEEQNPVAYVILARGAEKDELEIIDCLSMSDLALLSLLKLVENIAASNGNPIIRFRINEMHPLMPVFKRAGYFWGRTQFKMLGRCLIPSSGAEQTISRPDKVLHWTVMDRNE